MKMGKHTSGPWEKYEIQVASGKERAFGRRRDNGKGYAAVGKIITNSVPTAHLDANWNLCSAAPDLLELAEAFVKNYAGMEDGDGNEAPELAMARAAIAKARGE